MQLFRVDGNGVKPLPAVSAILEGVQSGSAARPSTQTALATPVSTAARDAGAAVTADTMATPSASPEAAPRSRAAATAAPLADGQLLAQAGETSATLSVLSQQFTGPLPPNLSGNIRLVSIAEDGTLGNIVEEIPFSSPNVSFSPDRTQLFVRPSAPIAPGQSVMMQLPSRSVGGVRFVYPNHLVSTPCVFKAPAVSSVPGAVAPVAAAPAAAAASFPVWAIVAGVIVVGVGVAAAAGAFTNGGGGGGTNTSSQ